MHISARGAPLTDALAKRLGAARRGVMVTFFVTGLLFASWGVHVPTVRDRFQLSPGTLSFALLAVAIGALAAMLTTGKWIDRVGSRQASLAGGAMLIVSSPLILLAPTFALLIVVLLFYGFGMATIDVAMNAEASVVEKMMQRPVMSSMHGMFSLGGMVGAAAGSFLLAHGMLPLTHLLISSGVSAAALAFSLPRFLPVPPRDAESATPEAGNRWRSATLWALGILALVTMIAEGAMYDWASVYVRDVLGGSAAMSSAAYGAFSAGMALGRFSGDAIRARLGVAVLLVMSGALGCVSMAMTLLLPYHWSVMSGFALLGLGLSNMMPLLFAGASRVTGIRASEGLAHVAGLAYFGVLLGPVVIGGVAQISSLTTAFWLVAACCMALGLTGPAIVRRLGL